MSPVPPDAPMTERWRQERPDGRIAVYHGRRGDRLPEREGRALAAATPPAAIANIDPAADFGTALVCGAALPLAYHTVTWEAQPREVYLRLRVGELLDTPEAVARYLEHVDRWLATERPADTGVAQRQADRVDVAYYQQTGVWLALLPAEA